MNSGDAPQRRILLVEDDSELREALADALTDRGHHVVAVNDGREALEEMRAVRPDIVVLDLMMPVMDGWQFRLEQKRDPALAETPVVAISASQSPTAAAVDADLYLQKPLDVATLLQAIEDVLLARERMREPAKIAQTERMAALGTLAAGMAHEINNPLTYVLLHLTHVIRLLPAVTTEQNRVKVEQIDTLVRGALEGVERIRGITSGIRSFSRVGAPSQTLLDVRIVLDATLKLLRNEIRHRAQLTRDFSDVSLVVGDEGRLGQVFLNLLTNAVQAIPEGSAAANHIRVRTATEGDRVIVEVSDTGPGIPDHLLARIFEPFFSTKPVGQGMGLGLSISHGIVGSLGGEIRVSTEVGLGTTFRVSLPAVHATTSHAATDAGAVTDRPSRRILVIDDEAAVGQAIRDALGPEHEVSVVASGREALRLLARNDRYDAVLCDLHMPDLTGAGVHEQLREAHPELAARIIFMTAGVFTERARDFLTAGNHPFVDKPLDVDKVRALLAKLPPRP